MIIIRYIFGMSVEKYQSYNVSYGRSQEEMKTLKHRVDNEIKEFKEKNNFEPEIFFVSGTPRKAQLFIVWPVDPSKDDKSEFTKIDPSRVEGLLYQVLEDNKIIAARYLPLEPDSNLQKFLKDLATKYHLVISEIGQGLTRQWWKGYDVIRLDHTLEGVFREKPKSVDRLTWDS